MALRVRDELLAIGCDRPVTPPDLVKDLQGLILSRTQDTLAAWPERSMWVSKSALQSVQRCEAGLLADRATPRSGLNAPLAVGQVAHRAIQVAHTHPDQPVEQYVRSSIAAQQGSDSAFGEFWASADMAVQSDVIAGAVSKVTAFLDSWPALLSEWQPRFEDPMQVKVGKLTLSVRPDLILGRPRPDMRQTMFLCDFKTGDIKEEHDREALLYALVATLRHGVAPFRSCVYSLSSGQWAAPDVTRDSLMDTAQWVATQACALAAVLGNQRPAVETTGTWCSWCPAKSSCVSYANRDITVET